MAVLYQLKPAYVANWRGGTVNVNGQAYDVGAALTAGGGTITATDGTLQSVLDSYYALQRVGSDSTFPQGTDFYSIYALVPPTSGPGDVITRRADGRYESAAPAGGSGGTVADASTTVKGASKLSSAPATATNPIAVGTNDTRVTADQATGTASIRTLGTGGTQAAAGDHTHAASAIAFTPTGTIAATTVQAAVAEVASEAGSGGGSAAATPIGERLLQAMANDDRDVAILIISDSTAAYSTSADLNKWPYLLATSLGAAFPRYTIRNTTWSGTLFANQETLQTGTGTHTLWIENAGWGGKGPRFHQTTGGSFGLLVHKARGKLPTAQAQGYPELVFISHGHNDGTGFTATPFRDDLLALCEVINMQTPGSEIVLISQNPRLPFPGSDYQEALIHQTMAVAQARGYGYINVWKAFVDASPGGVPVADPTTGALVQSDGIHPNNAGYTVWSNAVYARMSLVQGVIPRQQESSLSVPVTNLLANGDFAAFAAPPTLTSWTATNVTPSKDTTAFESGSGYAVKLTSATAAAAYISQAVTPLSQVLGRQLTLSARLFVAQSVKTASLNSGIVSIVEAGGSNPGETLSTASADGVDAFLWISTSRFISADATSVTIRLYSNTGAVSSVVTYDRAMLCKGLLPRDVR